MFEALTDVSAGTNCLLVLSRFLLQNVFSYYRMCSLTTACVLSLSSRLVSFFIHHTVPAGAATASSCPLCLILLFLFSFSFFFSFFFSCQVQTAKVYLQELAWQTLKLSFRATVRLVEVSNLCLFALNVVVLLTIAFVPRPRLHYRPSSKYIFLSNVSNVFLTSSLVRREVAFVGAGRLATMS